MMRGGCHEATKQLHTLLVRPETHTGSLLSLTEVEITVGNLAAALSAQAKRTPGPRCSVGLLLVTLDETDRKTLAGALSSSVPGSEIAAALRSEGYHMKGHTVQRHRNGECGCSGTR